MKQTFQSNINCSSCERMVSNSLNKHPKIESWSVDFNLAHKPLTIIGTIDSKELSELLNDLGFEIKSK